jgi:ElaB/YqjD/DUF883 family membrane-anchored ribosome-binding protein
VDDTDVETKDFEVPEEVATYVTDLEKRLADTEAKLAEEVAKSAGGDAETVKAEIAKALASLPEPIRKRLEESEAIAKAATEQAAKAEEIAKAERDRREVTEEVAKAHAYDRIPGWKADEMGPVIKALREKAPDELERLRPFLAAANEAIAKGALFTEMGTAGRSGIPSEAEDEVEVKAKELVAKSDGKVTIEKARVQVVSGDRDLYERIAAGRAGRNGSTR